MFDFEIFIPIVMMLSIAYIVKIVSDNRVRKSALEKDVSKEDLKHLFDRGRSENGSSSLKWGIVLIAVGAALFISQMLPYENIEAITIGLVFLFAGIGLIASYVIASKNSAKKDQ